MHHELSKISVPDLISRKGSEKITALTAYDYTTAKIFSDCNIDLILVGDSLGMVIQGFKNTLKVTLDDIIYHTSLVMRAKPRSLVVSDMPFGSFHVSKDRSVNNAIKLVKEGGAEAVKIEGCNVERLETIEAIVHAEIPVLGHLGLTPQSLNKIGSFHVTGKQKESAEEMIRDAKRLENAGVFGIVLESIPSELGKKITESVSIPTIGIGAGKYCDGQILVVDDMLGLTGVYLPKFVRKYADLNSIINNAVKKYADDVRSGNFPGEKESYHNKK